MVKYLKVWQYTPATDEADGITDHELYEQGYIFKDERTPPPIEQEFCPVFHKQVSIRTVQ
ncbi:hypothetical protein [Sporomusa acidovorans]|uniref:Uncharacterized protein n=1 Tax=Sporomusa acidovorans (strain ATCC 49682 / DSM 3132 / Mol) TaxID=1123286 RepID=A0ABZ3IZP1_SPOA4|nr:hypothetical protein [Sporomusa acidovorans]OZC19214.1 hypothetical protein SPACI_33000 [Sporomusa acidovorans DSM 3132]SDF10735.1 hypothetical protein SAMN04488499_10334 [Sporomusa acidovorans]